MMSSSWFSAPLFASLSAAVSIVASSLKEGAQSLEAKFEATIEEERKRLNDEESKLDEKKHKEIILNKRSGFPLWTVWGTGDQSIEKGLENRILSLALDIKNFAYSAAAPNDEAVWKFTVEEWTPWCELALKLDTNLATRRYRLVPRKLTDEKFWRSYMWRVEECRKDMGVPLLYSKIKSGIPLPSQHVTLPIAESVTNNNARIPIYTGGESNNSSTLAPSSSSIVGHHSSAGGEDHEDLQHQLNQLLLDEEEEKAEEKQKQTENHLDTNKNSTPIASPNDISSPNPSTATVPQSSAAPPSPSPSHHSPSPSQQTADDKRKLYEEEAEKTRKVEEEIEKKKENEAIAARIKKEEEVSKKGVIEEAEKKKREQEAAAIAKKKAEEEALAKKAAEEERKKKEEDEQEKINAASTTPSTGTLKNDTLSAPVPVHTLSSDVDKDIDDLESMLAEIDE